jgi:6-phosphogluconolactonase (cycloisomerase 2 family)
MSNAVEGNQILAFAQGTDGGLLPAGSTPTGGLGTGGGHGNQGALARGGEYLYAVNAGSNEISVLRFVASGLALVDVASSGGTRPVSVTVDDDVVYVLNAGSDSIAGFRRAADGRLSPLADSIRELSGTATDPAQIAFSADGRTLIVTERATNQIVTFPLGPDEVPVARHIHASPGATPFGFATGPGRRIYVSEAAGGAANASSVSSWRVAPDGELALLTPTAATHQSAACWLVLTPDGRFAYTTNTGSGTVSAFRVRGGDLDLLYAGVAAETGAGSAPIDVVTTSHGRFLHVLASGTDALLSFAIARDGSLSFVSEIATPDGANGLVTR